MGHSVVQQNFKKKLIVENNPNHKLVFCLYSLTPPPLRNTSNLVTRDPHKTLKITSLAPLPFIRPHLSPMLTSAWSLYMCVFMSGKWRRRVCVCVWNGGVVVRRVVEWRYLIPVGSAWVACHSLAPGQSGTCTHASLELITLCRGEGVVVVVFGGVGRVGDCGRCRETEEEKRSIWTSYVWEVKDRNGGYISYRGEFAMSRGVIISTKQTRRFYRDKLQDASDPHAS